MIVIEMRGLSELIARLKALGSQRIPNYMARAINDVANSTRNAMVQHTLQKLTVRGNWYAKGNRFGFNVATANKGKLEARVFSRAPWLYQQETQVFKTAQKSSLIVPMPAVRQGRTDPKKIPRRFLPTNMGAKLVKIETARGPVLFQRMKRAGLRAMWALERTIRYPRRVFVIDTARKAVDAAAPRAMRTQIDNAIREQGLK